MESGDWGVWGDGRAHRWGDGRGAPSRAGGTGEIRGPSGRGKYSLGKKILCLVLGDVERQLLGVLVQDIELGTDAHLGEVLR